MYVYLLSGVLCGLVVPAEVEEAVRLGELVSQNNDVPIFYPSFS